MSGKKHKEIIDERRRIERTAGILDKAMVLLNTMPHNEQRERLVKMLRTYVINNNCSLIVTPENPISPEHKLLIRDDCNGKISNIAKEYISEEYNEALCRKRTGGEYSTDDLRKALKRSVYQREMAEFPVYKAISFPLLKNLAEHGFAPSTIERMRISDFRDFIKEFCYDEFVKFRERQGFVKVFIRNNEQNFYNLLHSSGVHPAYIEKLIANMYEKGSADEFVLEYKGQRINGPGFDIDHKNPVYCPNDIKSYMEVNLPRSLAIVEKHTHRMKHKLERKINVGDGVRMYEKILLPQHCSAMLDFEHYMVFDFENPERQILPPQPHAENLIYLNKLEELVYLLSFERNARIVDSYVVRNMRRK